MVDFDPTNEIVKLCLQAMGLEQLGKEKDARDLFLRAFGDARSDLEKFIAAFHVARLQGEATEKLKWLEICLESAERVKREAARSALPLLHSDIATCLDALGKPDRANEHRLRATSFAGPPSDNGPFYHGTRADLRIGDELTPGGLSNYKPDFKMNHIYFTALIGGAGLAAGMAAGDKPERVYVVEPTGTFEDDPNVTNKKFPGNLTRSYRSSEPLKIVGEATDWPRMSPEELAKWRAKVSVNKGEIIN